MKKLITLILIILLILTGCGKNQQEKSNSDKVQESIPQKQDDLADTSSSKGDSKGVTMQVLDAVFHPEKLGEPIIFEVALNNGSSDLIDVGSLNFMLITKNGEIIETTLSGNSESRTVISGGKVESFKAAFELEDPGSVTGLAFSNSKRDIFVMVPGNEFPPLRTFGEVILDESNNPNTGNEGVAEDSVPKEEPKTSVKESAKSKAQTAADAIKIVESLDPGNYSADHDSSEYDITTVDGAFYFYINYSAASGMGGGVFVRKGTGEVFGFTMGTENDPNAPFPDFSNQIK